MEKSNFYKSMEKDPMRWEYKEVPIPEGCEPEWEVKIKRVSNGFELSYLEDVSEKEGLSRYRIVTVVFEDGAFKDQIDELEKVHSSDIDEELLSMYHLLYAIKDHFGCNYSKHNKINLEIKFTVEESEKDI